MTKKKTTKAVKAKSGVKKPTKKSDGMIIVSSPINPGQEFVIASELADDEAIEQELMGRAMEQYVYSFDQKGKLVTGLTVAGVNEMCRQLTKNPKSGIKVRINPESIKIDTNVEMDGNKGVSVTVIAENMLTGETGIGAKFEPYKKTGRSGSYENTFALEKAVSKAERNAKRKLIPEKLAIETIKKFVKSGKVQPLLAPVPQILSPDDSLKKAKLMIGSTSNIENLLEWDIKINKSKIYSKTQQKELHSLISKRVDEIDSKK